MPQASSSARQPRLGCGALVRRPDGTILLGKRLRPPEAGHWGVPGGKVDFMEPVEAAVRREIFEETGLEIRLARLLCLVDHFEPDLTPPEHWVAPVYLAEVPAAARAVLREPATTAALDWFALDALPAPLTIAAARAVACLGE